MTEFAYALDLVPLADAADDDLVYTQGEHGELSVIVPLDSAESLNGASLDVCGSFGGYKQSGVGREWGAFGFEEFLEVKSVFGADASAKAGLAELPG